MWHEATQLSVFVVASSLSVWCVPCLSSAAIGLGCQGPLMRHAIRHTPSSFLWYGMCVPTLCRVYSRTFTLQRWCLWLLFTTIITTFTYTYRRQSIRIPNSMLSLVVFPLSGQCELRLSSGQPGLMAWALSLEKKRHLRFLLSGWQHRIIALKHPCYMLPLC